MKDGETLQFSLNDRFSSSPIVLRDSASVPGSQGQVLTEDEKTELAWLEMAHDLSTAWQTPPQRPVARDQRPGACAQDQAAWAGSGQLPMVHCPSGSDQALQDDGSPEAAHAAMIAAMCNAWRKR
jgi:hypothetical protein